MFFFFLSNTPNSDQMYLTIEWFTAQMIDHVI